MNKLSITGVLSLLLALLGSAVAAKLPPSKNHVEKTIEAVTIAEGGRKLLSHPYENCTVLKFV